jgi:uncharacterized membrane protein YccC
MRKLNLKFGLGLAALNAVICLYCAFISFVIGGEKYNNGLLIVGGFMTVFFFVLGSVVKRKS